MSIRRDKTSFAKVRTIYTKNILWTKLLVSALKSVGSDPKQDRK